MEEEQASPVTQPDSQDTPQEAGAALAQAVARYRDLMAAGPGLIPELVQGSTIEEIDASVEVARQAYDHISRRIAAGHEAHIPAGNPARSFEVRTQALKPEAKIALGLRGK